MEKFRMKPMVYLICAIGTIIGCWLIYIENKLYMKVVLTGIVLVLLAGFINKAFKTYIVDEGKITVTGLSGTKVIAWNEVEHIYVYAKKVNWIGFCIYGKNDKIIIESGIKDYKRLMQLLIERCKIYNNVRIESEVIEHLKK